MKNIEGKDIHYTHGDTFIRYVSFDEIKTGDVLRFQITKKDNSSLVVDKMVSQSTNSTFEITLTASEKAKLPIGWYVYRISLISANGDVITYISGNFDIQWEADEKKSDTIRLYTVHLTKLTNELRAEAKARAEADTELRKELELTYDEKPVEYSENHLTSGAIYKAFDNVINSIVEFIGDYTIEPVIEGMTEKLILKNPISNAKYSVFAGDTPFTVPISMTEPTVTAKGGFEGDNITIQFYTEDDSELNNVKLQTTELYGKKIGKFIMV
ncbi:MAG: hypothetical protein IJ300_06975 [Clostridia bacterium]|nr:hypothetical protein [Clostridia bacterium]